MTIHHFEKYTGRHLPVHTYDGIRVSKPGIFLARSVRARLGDTRVAVYFDSNAQCILLKPDPDGFRVSMNTSQNVGLICAKRLSAIMPLGRYLYTGIHEGGYLFTYQP